MNSTLTDEQAAKLMEDIHFFFTEEDYNDVEVEYEDNDDDYANDDSARINEITANSIKTDYNYTITASYQDRSSFKQYPPCVTLKIERMTAINSNDNVPSEYTLNDFAQFKKEVKYAEVTMFNEIVKDGTKLIIDKLNAIDPDFETESGFKETEFNVILDNLLNHLEKIEVTDDMINNINEFLKESCMEEFVGRLMENKDIFEHYRKIFDEDSSKFFEIEKYLSDEMKEYFKHLTRGKDVSLLDQKIK